METYEEMIEAVTQLRDLPQLKNNIIPIVDPDDMRSLWKLHTASKDAESGIAYLTQGGSPPLSAGANPGNLVYRLAWLWWLQHFSEAGQLTFPWIDNGKVEDAVFKALAIVPMTGIPRSGREGFPFDLDELIDLIKKESKT